MHRNGLRSLIVVSCLAAFAAVGCGQGSPLSSSGGAGVLVGPTALTMAAFDAASASMSDDEYGLLGGRGRGNGGGNSGSGDDADDQKQKGPKGGHTDDGDTDDVEDADDVDAEGDDDDADGPKLGRGSLSGFVTATGTDTITVRGVVVTIDPSTVIRHGHRVLTIADITIGDHVQVKGTSTPTATGTTFTATEIKVEDMDGKDDDDDVDDGDVEGTISDQTGTCPALTFTLGAKTVTTNASTVFDDGACADLANGMTVKVEGTTQADGSILATNVELD